MKTRILKISKEKNVVYTTHATIQWENYTAKQNWEKNVCFNQQQYEYS